MARLIALTLLLGAAVPALAAPEIAPQVDGPVREVTLCGFGLPGDHPAGLDQDLDGVPDSEDWCPQTKAGRHVGSNGCTAWEVPRRCEAPAPAPAPAPAAAAPRAPAPVATDSDGDGVDDATDKCAGTPKGVAVDASGCAVIEKVVLKGVNFATGSARLLPAASGTLRTVASAMKANPAVEVEIGGYTDSVGGPAKNQRLSERRARSVKAFLVGEGIAESRLTVKGYGESDPVDSNDTPAGRANNRRVTFSVTRE